MNVIWIDAAVRKFRSVDLAVAVATERGLVAPVVRSVDTLRISDLAVTTADLAQRARAGALRAHELEGGAATVTNLGMFGAEEFAAIINPSQSAIVAVGAAREAAVVRDGALAAATVMTITASVDHRPIDGVLAARWLRDLVGLLQDPVQTAALGDCAAVSPAARHWMQTDHRDRPDVGDLDPGARNAN